MVYALLGSSPSLSMGPEATTALMTAIAIAPLAAGDPARYAELATTLALLVGLMSVAAWLLRLGFVADLLSRPVLVGYMAGVALIMIADQLRRVTGVPVTGQAFFAQLDSFARGMGRTQPTTVAMAAAVLAFLLLLRCALATRTGPAAGRAAGYCRRDHAAWPATGSTSSGRSRRGCRFPGCPTFILMPCASCCSRRSPC